MKNLSMISKPQTGYNVKKANVKKARAHASRARQSSYERFMSEHGGADIRYIGVQGGAVPQPRI